MSNDKVVSSAVPAPVSDPLTDLLRSGARRPIEAAVTAEFEEYLGGVRRPAVGGRSAPRGTQRPSSRTAGSDRDRGGRCAGAEGALPVWSGGAVPLFPGAALRASQCECRSGSSVAVPARGIDGQDASGRGGFGWRGGGPRAVGERGEPTEARPGRGVPGVVPAGLDDEWVYLWADGILSGLRGDDERLQGVRHGGVVVHASVSVITSRIRIPVPLHESSWCLVEVKIRSNTDKSECHGAKWHLLESGGGRPRFIPARGGIARAAGQGRNEPGPSFA